MLSTKLFAPPERGNLVKRGRLIEKFNAGLGQGSKLTLVSAPAGYGKTTAVIEWLRTGGVRYTSGLLITTQEAYKLCNRSDYSFASLGVITELTVALDLTGKRREAEALCLETINRIAGGREPIPLLGLVYNRLGALYYLANQLDNAHDCLKQGVELCLKLATDKVMGGKGKITLGNVQMALGQIDLARVLYAGGRCEQAWNMLSELTVFVHQVGIYPFFSKINALKAEFLLQGDGFRGCQFVM